ncbi:MAG TPA: hypothetical protein VFV79_00240 [Saprospiraceae bacterium]|nr:hypothetical protein [Saprospiraceae bacterium]
MKLQHLIMFQFILSIFGCTKSTNVETVKGMLGPFTIETTTQKGKTWNINYGRVPYSSSSYSVYYKDQPIGFGAKLETNTGVPGVWRVFLLKDSPTPALIAGSQSLYLVTIENDQPVVKTLFEQGYDFAAVQWLDSENGQPGIYREIFSSDERDTDLELTGGRYLAISHAVVLDTKTFTVYPFNTNNDMIDEYYPDQHKAIAFSPDSTQIVYGAAKQNADGYSYGLICYDFKAGTKYLVPYDKLKFRMYDPFKLQVEWMNDFFEWNKNPQGEMRLQIKALEKMPYHKGTIEFERFPGYQYKLFPVKMELMDKLFTFVQQELHLDTAKVTRVNEEFNHSITFLQEGRTFVIEYGKYGNDLVLYEDNNDTPFEINKVIIQRIGKGFNELLNQGRYQEFFTEEVTSY